MKSRTLMCVTAMTLLAALTLPVRFAAQVSGTNGKIAFGFGDAFTINPDGSQEHQIGPPGTRPVPPGRRTVATSSVTSSGTMVPSPPQRTPTGPTSRF